MDIEIVRDMAQDIVLDISEDNHDIMDEEYNPEVDTRQKSNITSVIIGMKENNLAMRKRKCDKCNKEFSTSFGLKKHIRLVHMEINDFNCDYCNKSFLNPRDLKDHENVHTKETSYLCPDCGDVFDTNKKMLNHGEKHKRNDQPCNICGKLIKNLASFKAHIRAHGLERAHSCKICGKSFKRNFDLTVHMRIHTGAKPYICDICNKSFSLSSTLSKHKKYHQSSAQTFPCNLCKMIFPGAVELGEHSRDVHRQFIVVEEGGQLVMREETNPMMPNGDGPLESIIIETKNATDDSGLVEFQ